MQVGGRRIGSVRKIALTDDNQAEITISVQDGYAPLHEGTTALIRATSLSGIANRYIALTPGPNSNPKLSEGATLGTDKTTSIVDLDQLFNTLDPKTRASLQQFIQGNATWYDNRGVAGQRGDEVLQPGAERLAPAGQRGRRQPADAQRLPAQRGQDDRARWPSAAATSRTSSPTPTRPRRRSATRTRRSTRRCALLPGTLRKANTTFVNLRATLDDLDVLVAASKPATKDLARFLSQLRPLVQEARPTIADLNTLVHRNGAEQRPHRPAGQGAGAREGRQAVVRALDHGAAEGHAGDQVPAALHARPRRLAARLRPGVGATTTPTATSRASSRSSTPTRSTTTRPAARSRRSRPASASPGCRPARSGAARARPRRRRVGRLGALPRHRRLPGLRPEPRAPRPMKRILAIACVLVAAARAGGLRARARATTAAPTACGRSS